MRSLAECCNGDGRETACDWRHPENRADHQGRFFVWIGGLDRPAIAGSRLEDPIKAHAQDQGAGGDARVDAIEHVHDHLGAAPASSRLRSEKQWKTPLSVNKRQLGWPDNLCLQ
jgi:hypothetical protein